MAWGILQTIHDILILLCSFVIRFHLGIFLKLFRSLAHDILYPRVEHGHLVATHTSVNEHIRTKHIVEIIHNKISDKLVCFLVDGCVFCCQFRIDHVHVTTVHNGLIMLVNQVHALVHELSEFLTEIRQFVVEWCAGDAFLCVIYHYHDFSTLKHHRQAYVVVQKDIGNTHRVYSTLKLKLSMHHVTRIQFFKYSILVNFQIQFLAVKSRYI